MAKIKIIPYTITFGPWFQTFKNQQVAPNICFCAKSKNDMQGAQWGFFFFFCFQNIRQKVGEKVLFATFRLCAPRGSEKKARLVF